MDKSEVKRQFNPYEKPDGKKRIIKIREFDMGVLRSRPIFTFLPFYPLEGIVKINDVEDDELRSSVDIFNNEDVEDGRIKVSMIDDDKDETIVYIIPKEHNAASGG